MGRLFKSFFFKLSRDLTFRIILIIGAGLAFLMTGLFLLIDLGLGAYGDTFKFLTGPNMLISAFNPVDNFGLAIPICLITFVCLEFSQGTIRNKIIAGHSKFKIYSALALNGLVLAFSLLFVYAGLCTLLGTIFGGFDLDNPIINMSSLSAMMGGGYADGWYIAQMLITAIVVYASIVSFTVFIAALFRNVGPCIPVVIIILMMLAMGGTLITLVGDLLENDALITFVEIVDPLYVISGGGLETNIILENDVQKPYMVVETGAFVATIINNLVYAAGFFVGGAFIFAKRDVK